MSDDNRLAQLDYYTLLGVTRDASIDDIKRAFRTFARRYHPDRFAGAPEAKIERATRIYRRGSEAVQTLTDVESRRAYDAALAKGELRLRDGARPRAATAPQPQTTQPTIHSSAARAYFVRAQELARAGDFKGAWQALKSARDQEPGSELIELAIQKVEAQLRARPR